MQKLSRAFYKRVNPMSTANNAKVSSTRTVIMFGTSRCIYLRDESLVKGKMCDTQRAALSLPLRHREPLSSTAIPTTFLPLRKIQANSWLDRRDRLLFLPAKVRIYSQSPIMRNCKNGHLHCRVRGFYVLIRGITCHFSALCDRRVMVYSML